MELVRKPDCVSGDSRGNLPGHWGHHWEGVVVPAVKICDIWECGCQSPVNGHTGKFPLQNFSTSIQSAAFF